MEALLKQFLDKYNLDLTNKKVVVAVSTGVDSMTLLDLLMKSGLSLEIIVAHVNHKKRKESDLEEEFIRKFCKNNNLKIYVKTLNKEEKSVSNFQSNSRTLRKEFFKEVLKQENANYLFLAHHLNDDIETMLMRIVRGSNLQGYSGINQLTYEDGYYILRPLLTILKEDIVRYQEKHNLTYFEDQSNQTDVYTRNRFRHNIVKNIFEENSDAAKSFLQFKYTMLASSHIINEYRDLLIANKFQMLDNDSGFCFKKSEFLVMDEYMQIETLFHLLKKYDLSRDNILELIKQIKASKKNIIFSYKKKQLTLVKEYDDIYCYFKTLNTSDVNIKITGIGTYPISDNLAIIVSKNLYNSVPTLKKIWYNSNKLPVVARSKQDGDVISCSCGNKKVSRILIDNKVGITKRSTTLLLVKDDEILAVFGYAKSTKLMETNQDDLIIELKEL